MRVAAHEPSGYEGVLVSVEVDLRRGIPAVDLVGLADGAIREARERVRAAVRNSGFEFPSDRVLINLAPAGLRKEGSSYDLPMALAVLVGSGALPDPGTPFLALGELSLDGEVRPVRAVLPAVASGLAAGISRFIVPAANRAEAEALGRGSVYPIRRLGEALALLAAMREGRPAPPAPPPAVPPSVPSGASDPPASEGDFADIRGLARARRALEIAAAGGHNILLFGPPGSGKTLAARRLPSILPDLSEEEALVASSLHSLAGLLPAEGGLLRRPPFRAPHHGASPEGLLGGGRPARPGELSLAHGGVLFLDEAPEYRRDVLQALREPLEEGAVRIARAGGTMRFPSDVILVLAANPCPCGKLGKPGAACYCGAEEVERYWKRLGAPLLDRIDIRVPLRSADPRELTGPAGEGSAEVGRRVAAARALQAERYAGRGFSRNARIPPALVEGLCVLSPAAVSAMSLAASRLSLSSRACHSVMRLARTIADLAGSAEIGEEQLLEAVQHRRYGECDHYWEIG